MKSFIVCLLLAPLLSAAQDCKFKTGKDLINNKTTLSTGFIDLDGNTLSIDISSKEIDFFFVLNAPSVRCLTEETEATFNFEGGKSKVEYHNSGSMNCDGIFHIIFKNSAYTPSQLTRLASKKIVSLQFSGGSGKPYLIEFTPEQQQMLNQTLNCVIKEHKSVL